MRSTRCADGEADGVVSAGNTGALMAMAKFVLKTLPGIDRPAIASFFPTLRGESVMLDLGANVECDADNLVQFAVMGDVFARTVLGAASSPRVGLLNVGSEELEGQRRGARGRSGILRGGNAARSAFTASSRATTSPRGTVDVDRHRRLHRQRRAEDASRARRSSTAISCASASSSSLVGAASAICLARPAR